MNLLLKLIEALDDIESEPAKVREADKEFVNDINRRIAGTETMVITPEEQDRLFSIREYITQ